MSAENQLTLQQQIEACCLALDNKKAEDLVILHLGEKSSVTDYFIIATGTSDPHLRALTIEVEKLLDQHQIDILGIDRGGVRQGWMVVDAYDFIVHLFTKETRAFFNLEGLWKDAERIAWTPPAVPQRVVNR